MSTSNDPHQDTGPMERSHMKGMVQKNALESAALIKTSRHLESQKKAFVRQNTRDEEEMKNLLHRLHIEQQGSRGEDTDDADEGRDLDFVDDPEDTGWSRFDPVPVSNPYPVTIIPRFGGTPRRPNESPRNSVVSRSGAAKFRRKSVEYEDVQDALSSVSVVSSTSEISDCAISGSTSCLTREPSFIDWLATPDAISSVRRMRKSVTDQTHRKLVRKSSNDCQHSPDSLHDCSSTSFGSHSRSNSLKERPRRDSERDNSPPSIRKKSSSRRGGSLKERKLSTGDNGNACGPKANVRSYTLTSRASMFEVGRKQDTKYAIDKQEDPTKHVRKNSKKGQKQSLCRKLSNESNGSSDTVPSPLTRKRNALRQMGKDFRSLDRDIQM